MVMNSVKIVSSSNRNLEITAIPGHFVTSHSHINYYIDITMMKHDFVMAREAAVTLAQHYAYEKPVDTIICMDGSEVIGAFLAQELVTPEFNTNGQMIFRDNLIPMLTGRHVLLLLASVTTGKTIHRALECIAYYGGIAEGITAVFSVQDEIEGYPITHLFSAADLPGYQSNSFRDCPMCKQGRKIDALANSFGFSQL